MQAKQAVQQSKDNENSTGVLGKGNVVADILGAVGFGSETNAFHQNFKNQRSNWRGRPEGQVDICNFAKTGRGKDKGFSEKMQL